jgi:hypothetical protein
MVENSIIVPFGKYKGQPLEIMLADANYINYQKQQPGFMKWLQDNHITIYNIFTTGAPQIQDTPEHNRLQARFLENKFQLAFSRVLNQPYDENAEIHVEFEKGYDVHICYWQRNRLCEFRIEIKPHVGDDYPAVLRQMRINQKRDQYSNRYDDVLLIGRFESESISLEQLRGIFGQYKIVMLVDVEAIIAQMN